MHPSSTNAQRYLLFLAVLQLWKQHSSFLKVSLLLWRKQSQTLSFDSHCLVNWLHMSIFLNYRFQATDCKSVITERGFFLVYSLPIGQVLFDLANTVTCTDKQKN